MDFVEDPEDLIWVNRSQGQIVVGVATVIEMKAPEHVFGEQPGDDLLNILGRVVVSGINKNLGLWACGTREDESHPPVGDVRVIKGGFEGFVLNEQALVSGQLSVRFLQRFRKPLLALTDVCRPGIIRTVRKPKRNIPAV